MHNTHFDVVVGPGQAKKISLAFEEISGGRISMFAQPCLVLRHHLTGQELLADFESSDDSKFEASLPENLPIIRNTNSKETIPWYYEIRVQGDRFEPAQVVLFGYVTQVSHCEESENSFSVLYSSELKKVVSVARALSELVDAEDVSEQLQRTLEERFTELCVVDTLNEPNRKSSAGMAFSMPATVSGYLTRIEMDVYGMSANSAFFCRIVNGREATKYKKADIKSVSGRAIISLEGAGLAVNKGDVLNVEFSNDSTGRAPLPVYFYTIDAPSPDYVVTVNAITEGINEAVCCKTVYSVAHEANDIRHFAPEDRDTLRRASEGVTAIDALKSGVDALKSGEELVTVTLKAGANVERYNGMLYQGTFETAQPIAEDAGFKELAREVIIQLLQNLKNYYCPFMWYELGDASFSITVIRGALKPVYDMLNSMRDWIKAGESNWTEPWNALLITVTPHESWSLEEYTPVKLMI